MVETRGLIDAGQLGEDLRALSEFGAAAGGGVTRVAYSDADLRAREWLDGEFASLGMSVRRDEAGNSIAVLQGEGASLRAIAVGSHTDSVPEGGRYDGALGVVAALACARALHAGEVRLRHPLAVINFAAEEATMAGATLGSRAFAGELDRAILARLALDGRTVSSHLTRAGLDPDAVTMAGRSREPLAAYLELHIEQGPVLDAERVTIGIVGIRPRSTERPTTPARPRWIRATTRWSRRRPSSSESATSPSPTAWSGRSAPCAWLPGQRTSYPAA